MSMYENTIDWESALEMTPGQSFEINMGGYKQTWLSLPQARVNERPFMVTTISHSGKIQTDIVNL